jgi:hypothetical protein
MLHGARSGDPRTSLSSLADGVMSSVVDFDATSDVVGVAARTRAFWRVTTRSVAR